MVPHRLYGLLIFLILALSFRTILSSTPEEKTRAMCEEYAKAVYASEEPAVLLPNAVRQNVSLCGIVEVPLIIGGVKAGVKEFPHMAVIGYGNVSDITWLCGGALISDRYVMTAGHCLESEISGPARWVRLGDRTLDQTDPDARAQQFKVARCIKHPSYKQMSSYFDIALLELDGVVEFDAYVRPACLQVNHTIPWTKAIATGFGKTDYFDDDVNNHLMKVTLSLLSKEKCKKSYEADIGTLRLRTGIHESQMCAGEIQGGKDTCQGDSGGPLQQVLEEPYCMYSIVGVTSFGRFCGFKNSPAVYTKVDQFVPWIASVVWA